MLMDRLFHSKDEQVVYHYCSAETLSAILESKRIRFTDINMLNDSYETKWGYAAFEEAAIRLIKRSGVSEAVPEMPEAFFDSVDEILSKIQTIAHPFVSCFSLDSDSLEQWRAYADDGRGFAIGFYASKLQQLPVSVLSVEYDRESQIKEMMAALVALYFRKNADTKIEKDKFFEDCVLTATYMVAFKHSAFRYEQELRCLHAVNLKFENESIRFVNPGGQHDNGKFEGLPVNFQVRDNHLCAYLDMPFCAQDGAHPIAEIILGPKNHSHAGNVLLYLGGLGYSKVGLRASRVPYR
jgi:Protein of unknown function (DUF2971)